MPIDLVPCRAAAGAAAIHQRSPDRNLQPWLWRSTCLPDDRNTLRHCRSDFITLAPDQTTSGIIAGLVLLVLVLDWVVMLFAHSVIRGAGALLQLFGVILGVTQVALGLRIIIISLAVWGYSSCRSNPGRVPDSVR